MRWCRSLVVSWTLPGTYYCKGYGSSWIFELYLTCANASGESRIQVSPWVSSSSEVLSVTQAP
jgi:hypothetical protein